MLYYVHCLFFQATVAVWPQLVQRDESVAELQARGDSASAAASVVDTMSVAWHARDVVTSPVSVGAKPGAVTKRCSSLGKPRGTRLWSSMWRQQAA